MIGDIINGIAAKLHEVFGENYVIYKENVKQNLQEPCFMIDVIEPMQFAKLPTRYLRSYPMDVLYFPKDTINSKEEIYEIAERLFIELEYIFVLDNLCRGTKMRYEIVDDVLHFFVNYDFFVNKRTNEEENHMSELTVDSNTEV